MPDSPDLPRFQDVGEMMGVADLYAVAQIGLRAEEPLDPEAENSSDLGLEFRALARSYS